MNRRQDASRSSAGSPRVQFAGLTLEMPKGWSDFTEDGGVWTLGRENGVGALQFSVALYESGPQPEIGPADLHALLADFAAKNGLGARIEPTQRCGTVPLVGATFQLAGDLIRVWYVSGGKDVALVTYLAAQGEPAIAAELADAEQIVASIRFA